MSEPLETVGLAASAVSSPGRWRVLGAALLVALFGACSGMHVLGLLAGHASFLTTRQIEQLMPTQSLLQSLVPPRQLPTARFVDTITHIGSTPWLLAVTLAAGLLAAAVMVGLLNPGWWADVRAGRLAPYRLVVAVLASPLVVAGALWPLPTPIMATAFPLYRAAFAGGLVWLLWHRRGWLHPRAEPPNLLLVGGQLLSGAVVGIAAHSALRHVLTPLDRRLLELWLENGLYVADTWRNLALYALGYRAWGGLAVGTLACFLAQPGRPFRQRVGSVLVPTVLVVGLLLVGKLWHSRVWVGSYRLGQGQERLLTGLQREEPQARAVIGLTDPGRPLLLRFSTGLSALGLPCTPAVDQACQQALKQLGGRTGAARTLYVQLHESATDRWDPEGALAVLRAQQQSPTAAPLFAAALAEAVTRGSSSPASREAATALLDARSFARPRDYGTLTLGQVAHRWGRYAEVAAELARARPAEARALGAQAAPTPGASVTGRVLLNGEPLVGARVGLVSDQDFATWLAPPRVPLAPWQQRQVVAAATTAADGSFRLTDLFGGDYRLVLKLDPARLGTTGVPMVSGFRGLVRAVGGQPRDLGAVELTTPRRVRRGRAI